MVKTQVQIPDDLYRRAKQIAKEREISLAEVFRRGLEYMSRTHPPLSAEKPLLPVLSEEDFVEDFDDLDLRALTAEDEVRHLG